MNYKSIIFAIVLCLCINCASSLPQYNLDSIYFTVCNIWFEDPMYIDSINYPVGTMLPAGSEVKIISINDYASSKADNYIHFRDLSLDLELNLFIGKYNTKLSILELFSRTFIQKKFKDLTDGLTDEEIRQIQLGEYKIGMSKKAIIIARGYPPTHKTPSIESNTWTYYKNRWAKEEIFFNNQGKAISINN